jgi:hypothetical protein
MSTSRERLQARIPWLISFTGIALILGGPIGLVLTGVYAPSSEGPLLYEGHKEAFGTELSFVRWKGDDIVLRYCTKRRANKWWYPDFHITIEFYDLQRAKVKAVRWGGTLWEELCLGNNDIWVQPPRNAAFVTIQLENCTTQPLMPFPRNKLLPRSNGLVEAFLPTAIGSSVDETIIWPFRPFGET